MDRKPRLVSVILPMHNASATVDAQLDALARQDFAGSWELIAVDNLSTDDSGSRTLSHIDQLPMLRVCSASEGRGAAVARNRGVAVSRGDLLVFCDADDVAHPQWLSELVNCARTADLVGGREVRVVTQPDGALRVRPGQSRTETRAPHLGFLPFAVGGNAAVWRYVVDDVGGWREDFLRGQDAEFSWRAQVAGYRFAFAPAAVMYYRDRSTLWATMHQHYVWGIQDARLVALYRHAGCRQTPWLTLTKRLAWLVSHIGDLAHSRWRRTAYLKVVAACAGRLRGSMRHHVRLL